MPCGVQVTLNHWARPVKSTDAGSIAEYGNDWTLMQMASTNNVECPEWLDWFHGGLQFQIECAARLPGQEVVAVLPQRPTEACPLYLSWRGSPPCTPRGTSKAAHSIDLNMSCAPAWA